MHYLYAYIGMFWKDKTKILRVQISLFAKFDLGKLYIYFYISAEVLDKKHLKC